MILSATRLLQNAGGRGKTVHFGSSKESQAAYRALGCTPAEEVNEGLAAVEPFDVQMEYRL